MGWREDAHPPHLNPVDVAVEPHVRPDLSPRLKVGRNAGEAPARNAGVYDTCNRYLTRAPPLPAPYASNFDTGLRVLGEAAVHLILVDSCIGRHCIR